MQDSKISFWEKYVLTIDEAAKYFHLGENKLRQFMSENKDANFILYNGNRILIKRKLFEKFVDKINYI